MTTQRFHPTRGELVDIGGRRMRAVRAGPASERPKVILEAGSFGCAADWAVVVRNDHGPGVAPLPDETRVIRTAAAGPAGWREGMEAVLGRLGIGETDG